MCQLDRLRQMQYEIKGIAQRNSARRLFVFGSCARREETPGSDIDFIAEFNDSASLFDHAGLELALQDLLGCQVDVVNYKRLATDDAFSRSVKPEMIELC